jgi:hypothetical protein
LTRGVTACADAFARGVAGFFGARVGVGGRGDGALSALLAARGVERAIARFVALVVINKIQNSAGFHVAPSRRRKPAKENHLFSLSVEAFWDFGSPFENDFPFSRRARMSPCEMRIALPIAFCG